METTTNDTEYAMGWAWAGDKLRDLTPAQVRVEGMGAAIDSGDPDAFYEGVLDRVKKFR